MSANNASKLMRDWWVKGGEENRKNWKKFVGFLQDTQYDSFETNDPVRPPKFHYEKGDWISCNPQDINFGNFVHGKLRLKNEQRS
jgi:hypothetical protein